MGQRLERFAGEASKFVATGFVATFFAVVLFNWLVHWAPMTQRPLMEDYPATAYVVANSISMCLSYYLTRRWAFKHREVVGVAGGFVTYSAINLATMAIPTIVLWLSRNWLGFDSALADNVAANIIGNFMAFLARFWSFRTFVFKMPQSKIRTEFASHVQAATRREAETDPGGPPDHRQSSVQE